MRYYDHYDFEEELNKKYDHVEEKEFEEEIKLGKRRCAYVTNTIKSKNVKDNRIFKEQIIYPAWFKREDIPKREKKKATKAEKIAKSNKRARRNLTRLININFGKGDLWCTFGWDKENYPENEDRARKDIKNFILKINRKRKKQGKENIKYIYVLAYSEYERPHVHMILEGDLSRDALEELWTKGGRKNTRRIVPDESGMIIGLCEYILKNPHGTKRWCCSRNLKRAPEPTKSYTKFKKKNVEEMVKDYKVLKMQLEKKNPGYTFIDAEVKWNGVVAAFYIYARMVRN